jgi:ferritin-like metal-binding protein YciE
MGNVMALGHAAATDEVIKNTLENAAFEHYEVAMYKSLLAMAEECGANEAVSLIEQSLHEEEQMAYWVDEHVGDITRAYLHRTASH